MKIAIISGSARPTRQSHQVALALQDILQNAHPEIDSWVMDVKELNLPLLDNPLSLHSSPSSKIVDLGNELEGSDAFIAVSPEHNGSYSGALKNTMDYFLPQFEKKAFGVVAVSEGMLGGVNAAKNLQIYCLHLKGVVLPQYLLTPHVAELFTDGKLTDASYERRLKRFVDDFMWLVNKLT